MVDFMDHAQASVEVDEFEVMMTLAESLRSRVFPSGAL